ncbi:NADP-dependent oxidoreductase [Pedobacter rhizosphaerae]|uniref:NADPH:quinone reductase n=1 Tax=Pedobacter rhizosphaerae TaxID=390241 RepID=A0A1H9VK48_9SPHI|nr:NADP-dependent oxidoreductase [Pedobacter rhizosphaerae]SES21918.1 NADPH:quinone reductase [Pedobacter rhizosphaerae]
MKAIILKDFGGVDQLQLVDVPVPVISASEVLIETKAISINPIDVKTRSGKGIAPLIKDQMPAILGWDISGVVSKVGESVSQFKVGDEVFGMITFPQLGKAYAEYVAAPADELTLKPKNVSHNDAAPATVAALTAWQALTLFAEIKPGDRVLIHAASGGVGHYAVQLAKHLGAYVIGTSSAANRDFVLSLGADEHIDYKNQAFEEVLDRIDFVLDSIGGEYIDRSLQVMNNGGTIVCIPSGLNETVVEKAAASNKHGFTMRAKSSAEDLAMIGELLAKGTLRSHVDKVYSFKDMALAHQQIESGRTVGKIVLTP